MGDFIMSRSELEGMMCEELSAHRNELGGAVSHSGVPGMMQEIEFYMNKGSGNLLRDLAIKDVDEVMREMGCKQAVDEDEPQKMDDAALYEQLRQAGDERGRITEEGINTPNEPAIDLLDRHIKTLERFLVEGPDSN